MGSPTEQASLEAAQAMVTAYGMNNLNVAPALSSNHTRGTAINMNISWSGTLTIAGAMVRMLQLIHYLKPE